MDIIQRVFLLILLVAVPIVSTRAQDKGNPATPTATPAPQRKVDPPICLPTYLVQFFSSEWTGAGEFASGKAIKAGISFKSDLDNQWLVYRHTDCAPNRYKALGMWGFEYTSKQFVMVMNDNFGGLHLFSSEGWRDGKIVF